MVCDIAISASLVYYFSTLRVGMEKSVCFSPILVIVIDLVTVSGRSTFCNILSYSLSIPVYSYGKLSHHNFRCTVLTLILASMVTAVTLILVWCCACATLNVG